ncbi:MAG TPA: methyltransferase [Desulfotomaculum sp.]|nr:MAG: methyltransferase [Peptococcaceae bacterium BRH_c8a]KJS77860.1 MAG: methyltransferase [Desulfotomaculum sp. BICA1-6]HBX24264.1 methyltransferase [Desulfotomaculum sp.]
MTIETRETTFELPGHKVSLLLVRDIEKLITDPGDEDKVPYWADIWPAAHGAAHWIWEHLRFDGDELIELGAGLGLPGIVCGLKGARVTFSDFNPLALEMAAANAKRNDLAVFSTLQADWRTYQPEKKYNWVLGSDIFYNPQLNIHLLRLLPKLITPGGCILAAHPGRPATGEFLQALRTTLDVVEEREAVVPVIIDDPYFPYYEIKIHLMKTN